MFLVWRWSAHNDSRWRPGSEWDFIRDSPMVLYDSILAPTRTRPRKRQNTRYSHSNSFFSTLIFSDSPTCTSSFPRFIRHAIFARAAIKLAGSGSLGTHTVFLARQSSLCLESRGGMTKVGQTYLTAVKHEVDLATPERRREMAHAQSWCLHVGDGCFMPRCLQKGWTRCFNESGIDATKRHNTCRHERITV